MGTRGRRLAATFAIVVAGSALSAGCGGHDPTAPAAGTAHRPANRPATRPAAARSDGYLLLTAAGGVVGVPLDGTGSTQWSGAVASADRSTVVVTRPSAERTLVHAVHPGTGEVVWNASAPGAAVPAAVSADGSLVALAPSTDSSAGRTTTAITIAGAHGQRELTVQGNVEPEAFTTDGRGLVVVDYLPPEAPTEYTIKMLDVRTGKVSAVRDVDGDARAPMRGTARTSVMSRDGTRLYTYYAAPGTTVVHGERYPAFVHVLDLQGKWAHCVGLPAPFGGAPVGIGIDATGEQVVVADAQSGAVAEIDTARIALARVRTVDAANAPPGLAPVVTVARDRVAMAAGRTVRTFARDTLSAQRSWRAGTPVRGMRLDGDGRTLWVATDGRVTALDAVGLRVRRAVDVPGAYDVTSADPATRPLTGTRDEYNCACLRSVRS
jgi:hypothetical protein